MAAKTRTAKKGSGRVRVTLVRGWAGKSERQRMNLRSLGLRRSGDSRDIADSPSFRGMVDKVQHLVTVEDV